MTRKQIAALRCAVRALTESKDYKENSLFVAGIGEHSYLESISYQEAFETLIVMIAEEEKDETLSHSERP